MMEERRRNLKLVVEYDGTDFYGWQVQPRFRTVQGVMEEALARVVRHPLHLLAAGRTDSGVHALGQVASFRTSCPTDARKLLRAFNGVLPRDVAAVSVEEVPYEFHATFDAKAKLYRYRVLNRPAASPIERRFAHHCPTPLDIEAMRAASRCLVGEHDFSAFERQSAPEGQSVRRIFSVAVEREGAILVLEVRGSGFLWNMVRAIAGTLLEVGRGRRPPGDVEAVLRAGERARAGPTAPPQGLCLVRVDY